MPINKLGIKPTCCKSGWDGNFVSQEKEEIEAIREEYAFLLGLLEDLAEEFVAKYAEPGVPFIDFCERYWTDRMQKVMDGLESVDPEELQKIEELGVVLEMVE